MTERFWNMVDKSAGPSGCWPWMGHRIYSGYGQFSIKGKPVRAHRMAWVLEHGGSLDRKTYVLHQCDNPSCVNPKHLRLGTQTDNMADMVARGRQRNGTAHYSAKLSPDDVRRIREMAAAGLSTAAIASSYSVTSTSIHRIITGTTWRHV